MRSQLSLLSLLSFSSIRVFVVFHCLLSQFPLYLLQQVIIITTIETTETTFFRQWYPCNAKPVVSIVSIVVFFYTRACGFSLSLVVILIISLTLTSCYYHDNRDNRDNFIRQWYSYNAKPVVSVVSIVVFFLCGRLMFLSRYSLCVVVQFFVFPYWIAIHV